MQTATGKDDHLQSFREGEEKGFTYYFEALYPAMLFYALRLVKNKPVAENIVEESFIGLWEKHGSYETEKEIRQVLYEKVGTTAKTWLLGQGNGHADPSESDSHLPELIRTEVTRKLYSAIRELPPFYKQVFRLIYIQGKSLTEASEELNITETTLKDHQLIGLQYLKKNGQLA
jgi:RNA polymerase sigma-70 factor (ECF subfamily)